MSWPVGRPDSDITPRRQVSGSKSGSNAGKRYVRTAPAESEMIAGAVVTGPPVLPGKSDTTVCTRKFASPPLVSPEIRQQLAKNTVNGPLPALAA